MKTYAFLLGRKYLLSIAEILAILEKDQTVVDITPLSLIVECKKELTKPQNLLNKLGGTIKIAEIIDFSEKKHNSIPKNIANLAMTLFGDSDKKVDYAIACHITVQKQPQVLLDALKKTKTTLLKAGIKNRYINKINENAPLAQLKSENVPELMAIEGKEKYYYGRLVAFQDIDSYSDRDFKRPERDPKLGMLPPKLAQIMINFSDVKSGILYDPFCGIGSVLAEGLLMGFDVIGSDLEPSNIEKSLRNLRWLQGEFPICAKNNIRLFPADAQKLHSKNLTEKVDAVVTETYLGPTLSTAPDQFMIKENLNKIENLLSKWLETMHPLLAPNTPVVLSLLTYRYLEQGRRQYVTMDNLIDRLPELGYETVPLIPSEIREEFHLPSFRSDGLIYERADQIVCRTIFKLVTKH